ncbi:MAG TPA: hypothetical protein VIJ55_08055, partial [Acetobacteraceae bacterium]
ARSSWRWIGPISSLDRLGTRADNQSTLALHLVTNHGRATPLIWLTVVSMAVKIRAYSAAGIFLESRKGCPDSP